MPRASGKPCAAPRVGSACSLGCGVWRPATVWPGIGPVRRAILTCSFWSNQEPFGFPESAPSFRFSSHVAGQGHGRDMIRSVLVFFDQRRVFHLRSFNGQRGTIRILPSGFVPSFPFLTGGTFFLPFSKRIHGSLFGFRMQTGE